MPLPTDQTLSILPYSRPGDATQSKPKTAMLVRMSAETLAALESQPAQTQIQFEFGPKPGIYVGDTYFPMKHSSEESDASPHELFLRAASANKKAAPLKLFATVVGKFQVERELTKELRDKISGSTQDAVKQRNSRNIVFMDTPPDILPNPKKRKDPPASVAATMFRKPVKPADIKGPSAATTPIAVTKIPPPSAPSSSSKEPGGPLRTRVIRCLAVSPKPEEEVLKRTCGTSASQAQRREALDLLPLVAELDSTKKPPQYRLKPRSWLEVRPYEWSMTSPERIQTLRNAREAMHSLGLKDSDPAWEHVRDRSPVSGMPASSTTTSLEQSRPSTSTSSINGKNSEVQPKRGLSSLELKEKAKRPKFDPKSEITAKDESLRATRPAVPTPEAISRSESARSNLALERRNDLARMNPPEPRRTEPTRPNESSRAAESSAVRKPPVPAPEPRPAAPKASGRTAPSPVPSTSRKREKDDDRDMAEPAAVSRVSSTAYNEDKLLASQRIKRIKRQSGLNSDNEKERDRDRDRERVASPIDRAKAKPKREESPRDERLDRAKIQDRPLKRDESPRDERFERLRTQERPLKREESPRDGKAERLKARERPIKREESPRDEKSERLKARERATKREESPGEERIERSKLKEKAVKREESPRGDMRASTLKRKIVHHGDDDDEDDYRDGKTTSQVKRRKPEPMPSATSARAREREREQEQNDRDRERERERERERKDRDRERDNRDRERDKEREREHRIREREREERRKDGSPLKQSHVEPRSSKGAQLASSSRSKPSKREESPPPVKKKISAAVSAASPESHSAYSNDNQRSKSSSAKPRRRSPIYTSSEEEDEEDEALARRGTKNVISHSISSRDTGPRKLPTDRSSLRKRYAAYYDEYTEIYSRLITQRHILRKLRDSDKLPDEGSDSDGDSGLMDVDELEALTKKYNKLCNELKAIQLILERPLRHGEAPSAPEMLKA